MDDNDILDLYFTRDEGAIEATAQKYGAYCSAVARNILDDPQAVEECLNDTWLRCWNAIPPQRPLSLKSFAGRITRNLALTCLRAKDAQKRGGGQAELALDELSECVSGEPTPEDALDRQAVQEALDRFLGGLTEPQRSLFLRRYWYLDSISQLARRFGMSESRAATTLHRLRARLKKHLTQEGFEL